MSILNTCFPILAANLWRSCWQGSLLILVLWGVCRLFPRIPASVRSWPWWTACLKLLLGLCWTAPITVPFPSSATAAVEIIQNRAATGPASQTLTAAVNAYPVLTPPPAHEITTSSAITSVAPNAASSPPSRGVMSLIMPILVPLLLTLWILGVGVGGTGMFCRYRRAGRLAKDARLSLNPFIREEAASLAARLRLRSLPAILEAVNESGPLVVGILKPAIVLPRGAGAELSPSELRMTLAHELAHVRRQDLPLGQVPALAQVLFFFNPLALLAVRGWAAACEAACDGDALRATGAAVPEYASLLVKLAAGHPQPAPGMTLGATSTYRALKWRLKMLQHLSLVRRPLAVGAGLLVALTAATIIPWQIASRAAIRVDGPVRLDPSTPARQHGYTLLLVQPGGNGSYQVGNYSVGWGREGASACLVIRVPRLPDLYRRHVVVPGSRPKPGPSTFSLNEVGTFTVIGHSPRGTTFPLEWDFEGTDKARLMIVSLPTHLRDINPYVDVTVRDRWGHVAQWRVLGLPALRRLIPSPVTLVTQRSTAGMTLTARAWRGHEPYMLQPSPILRGEVTVKGTPVGPGQWTINGSSMTPEWGLPGSFGVGSGYSGFLIRPARELKVPFQSSGFPELNHVARMQVALTQFDIYEEKLTFHDLDIRTEHGQTYVQVNHSQTLTTPSGITITMPAQGLKPPARRGWFDGDAPPAASKDYPIIAVRTRLAPVVAASPGGAGPGFTGPLGGSAFFQPGPLPHSPLFQRYGKPVFIQVSSPQSDQGMEVSWSGRSPATLDFLLRKTAPRHIEEFTILITQQVRVRELPFTFTVPVTAEQPGDRARNIFPGNGTTTGSGVIAITTTGGSTSTSGHTATTGVPGATGGYTRTTSPGNRTTGSGGFATVTTGGGTTVSTTTGSSFMTTTGSGSGSTRSVTGG